MTGDSSQEGRWPGLLGAGWLSSAGGCAVLVGGAPARPGKAESGEATGWIRRAAGEVAVAARQQSKSKLGRHPAWNGKLEEVL